MDCILLAGGRPAPGEPLWEDARGAPKALLDIAGRPMIRWVLDALRAAEHIDRVVVVGLDAPLDDAPPGAPEASAAVEYVGDHGSLVANLYAGIERVTPAVPTAFCWSDIPLVTPAMIDRFIDDATDPTLDIDAGLVPRQLMQGRYPGADGPWLRTREGQFLASGFGLFHPGRAALARPHLEALMPQRKSAARQARYLGIAFLLRFISGRMTVLRLEAHLLRRFGLRCRVRILADPEFGLDVDDASNLALCRRVLADRWGLGGP